MDWQTDGHRKINRILFMDDLKLYGKNDWEVHTVRVLSEDIGMQSMIGQCATVKLQRVIVKNTDY